MSKATYVDQSCKIYQCSHFRRSEDGKSLQATFRTHFGFVKGYAYTWINSDGEDKQRTRFAFIWQGREYDRYYSQRFTERGMARLENRFAREVVAESEAE